MMEKLRLAGSVAVMSLLQVRRSAVPVETGASESSGDELQGALSARCLLTPTPALITDGHMCLKSYVGAIKVIF